VKEKTMAYHFFMKATGSDQGPLAGDSPHAGEGRSLCHQLHFKGSVNNDPNRSKDSAARSHEPLTIVKPWGPSSPQFMAAFWNNEPLSEVHLQFPQADGKGNAEAVFHEIHLTNATIASFELHAADARTRTGPEALGEAPPELEYISFRFEKMTVKNVPGKTIATFDFKNRG
jgi:type VI secretion system Hcp family effector